MLKRRRCLIVAIFVSFSAGAATNAPSQQADLSVHNVRLGMTAREVATAVGPGFPIIATTRFSNIPQVVVGALKKYPGNKRQETFALVYLSDKLVSIGYSTNYLNGEQPTIEDFKSALINKYGPYSDPKIPYHWFYDANSHVKQTTQFACDIIGNGRGKPITVPSSPFSIASFWPVRWREGCGTHIEMVLSETTNHLISSYTIILTNEDPGVSALKQVQAASQGAATQQHSEGSKNKPSL
jgi:hypothetical protein